MRHTPSALILFVTTFIGPNARYRQQSQCLGRYYTCWDARGERLVSDGDYCTLL